MTIDLDSFLVVTGLNGVVGALTPPEEDNEPFWPLAPFASRVVVMLAVVEVGPEVRNSGMPSMARRPDGLCGGVDGLRSTMWLSSSERGGDEESAADPAEPLEDLRILGDVGMEEPPEYFLSEFRLSLEDEEAG